MHHSQARNKFNILDQLEGALKRKAADRQKSRDSSNLGRNQQPEQRKSKDFWSITNRPNTQEKKEKGQGQGHDLKKQIKPTIPKVTTKNLFSNEGLQKIDTKQPKIRKPSINKRLQRLGSLIGYAISSAEKAIKYVNLDNFEAQFAVKLFRSDKDNVLNEMQILIEAVASGQSSLPLNGASSPYQIKSHTSITNQHLLKSQLSEIKKFLYKTQMQLQDQRNQNLHLMNEIKTFKNHMNVQDKYEKSKLKTKEKEIGNLLKQIHEIDQLKKLQKHKQVLLKHNLFLKEKEIDKLKRTLRSSTPQQVIEKYFETIEKETKFNLLIFSNFENSRKRVELEQILKTLEGERLEIERQLDQWGIEVRGKGKGEEGLKRFVRERVAGELGIQKVDQIDEIQILQKCLEKFNSIQKRDTHQVKLDRLQHQLSQALSSNSALQHKLSLLNQKSSIQSQIPIQLTEQLDLLKQNIDQIYEQLLKICHKNSLISQQNTQINIEELLNTISSSISTTGKSLKETTESLQFTTDKLARLNQRYESVVNENSRLSNAVQLLEFEKQDQQQVRDLERSNQQLRSRVDSLQREKSAFETRFSQLRERMSELKSETASKDRKLTELEQTLLQINRDKFSIANSYEELREEYDKLKVKCEKQIREKQMLEEEIEGLKEEMRERETGERERGQREEVYEQEIGELRGMLEKKEEQVNEGLEVIERMQKELVGTLAEISELSRAKLSLEHQLQQLTHTTEHQLQNLHSQHQSSTSSLLLEISQLQHQLQSLQQKTSSESSHTANLEHKLSRSNQKIESIQEQKERYQLKIEELQEEQKKDKQELQEINKRHEEEMRGVFAERYEKEEERERIIRQQQNIIGQLERKQQEQQQQQFIKQDNLLQSSSYSQQQQQIQQLLQQLSFKQQFIVNKQKQLLEKEKQMEIVRVEMESVGNGLVIREQEIKIKREEIELRGMEMEARDQEVRKKQQEIEERNERYESENRIWSQQLESITNELSSKQSLILSLEQQLSQLQNLKPTQPQDPSQFQEPHQSHHHQRISHLQSLLSSLQLRQQTLLQQLSHPIQDSLSIVDFGIQAYIPDSILQLNGISQSTQLNQLQNIVEKLNEEIVERQKKQEILKNAIEGKEQEIRRLRESIRIGDRKIRQMEEGIGYLNERVDEIVQINEIENGIQVNILESKKVQNLSSISIKRKEKEKNPAIKQINSQYSIQQQQNSNLQILNSSGNEIQSSPQLLILQQTISTLRSQLYDAQLALLHLRQQKQTEIFQYQTQIDQSKKVIENLKLVVSGTQSPRSSNGRERIDERALTLQKELLQSEKKKEEYEKEVMKWRVVVEEMKEKEQKEEEMKIERERVMGGVNGELDEIIRQFEQFKREKEMEGGMSERREQSLNNKIIQLTRDLQELKHVHTQNTSLQQTLYILQSSHSQLLLTHQQQLHTLSSKLSQSQEVNTSLQHQIQNLQQTIFGMKEVNDETNIVQQLRQVMVIKQQTIQRNNIEITELKRVVQENIKEIEELKQIVLVKEEEILRKKQKIEGLIDENGGMKEENDRLVEYVQQMQGRLDGEREREEVLREEIEKVKREKEEVIIGKNLQIQELYEQIKRLKDLETSKQQHQYLQKKYQEQNKELIEQLSSKTLIYTELHTQYQQIVRQIQELQSKNLMKQMEIESCRYLIRKVVKLGLGFGDLEGESVERMVEVGLERVKEKREGNRSLLEYSQSLDEGNGSGNGGWKRGERQELEVVDELKKEENLGQNQQLNDFSDFNNESLGASMLSQEKHQEPAYHQIDIKEQHQLQIKQEQHQIQSPAQVISETNSHNFSAHNLSQHQQQQSVISNESDKKPSNDFINQTPLLEQSHVNPTQSQLEQDKYYESQLQIIQQNLNNLYNNLSHSESLSSANEPFSELNPITLSNPPTTQLFSSLLLHDNNNNSSSQPSNVLSSYFNPNNSSVHRDPISHIYTPFETSPPQHSLIYSNSLSHQQPISKQSILPSTSNMLLQANSSQLSQSYKNHNNPLRLQQLIFTDIEIPFQVASHTLTMFEDQDGQAEFPVMTLEKYQQVINENYEIVEQREKEEYTFFKDGQGRGDDWIIISEDQTEQVKEEPFLVQYEYEDQGQGEFGKFEAVYDNRGEN